MSTVGLNTATVGKYIREQEMHDQMVDKLSVKEYGDPFSNATKRKRSEKASRYYRLRAAVQTTPFRRGFDCL